MIGYFRRFIPNFSTLTETLTNLLKKDVKFVWSDECEIVFRKLKSILAHPPILRLPNFSKVSKPFQLAIDASGVGIGSLLFQTDDQGHLHPISYYSKKLTKCQRNYSTIEKEAYALISSVKHFAIYLEYGRVYVFTDHDPLTHIHKYKNAYTKLLRWSLILQPYDLVIRHISGQRNIFADYLSRAPVEWMPSGG